MPIQIKIKSTGADISEEDSSKGISTDDDDLKKKSSESEETNRQVTLFLCFLILRRTDRVLGKFLLQ